MRVRSEEEKFRSSKDVFRKVTDGVLRTVRCVLCADRFGCHSGTKSYITFRMVLCLDRLSIYQGKVNAHNKLYWKRILRVVFKLGHQNKKFFSPALLFDLWPHGSNKEFLTEFLKITNLHVACIWRPTLDFIKKHELTSHPFYNSASWCFTHSFPQKWKTSFGNANLFYRGFPIGMRSCLYLL